MKIYYSISIAFVLFFLILILNMDKAYKIIIFIIATLSIPIILIKYKKENEAFVFALIGSMFIGVILGFDISIDEKAWHWTFSTIFQGTATLLGLIAIFLVYRLQIIDREIENSKKSLNNAVYGEGELSTKDLESYAKGQIDGLEEDLKDWLKENEGKPFTSTYIDIDLQLNLLKELSGKYNSKKEYRKKIKDSATETIGILAIIMIFSLYLLPVVNVKESFPIWLMPFREMRPPYLTGFIGAVICGILIVVYKLSVLLRDEEVD